MIERHWRSAGTACLLSLCSNASALQAETPAPMQQSAPPPTQQPAPPLVKPDKLQPGLLQPVPTQPGLVQPVPPATVATTSATFTSPTPSPIPEPTLGSELHSQIRENAQHFREKSAADKVAFALRQATELREFKETRAGLGFWERSRLARKFRAEQAQRRKEFDAEQETQRKTYEWRYP